MNKNLHNVQYVEKSLLIELKEKRKSEKILVIGDLHLGYEDSLNRSGIMVGRSLFQEMLKDFERLFKKVGKIDEIIFLGDIKHDFGALKGSERIDLLNLIDYIKKYTGKIIFIKGNHDNSLIGMWKDGKIEVLDFYVKNNFAFVHGDKDFLQIYDKKIRIWIMGHVHPAIELREGVKSERFKCFLVGNYEGKKIFVLPSFSEHSEGCDVRYENYSIPWNFDFKKFEAVVCGEKELNFGKIKDIS